jgi:hypothetical protein
MSETEQSAKVSVDRGELLETCRAAQAWGGYLRQRAEEFLKQARSEQDHERQTNLRESAENLSTAADRIDKAAASCDRAVSS